MAQKRPYGTNTLTLTNSGGDLMSTSCGLAANQQHYNSLSVQPIELMQATFTPEEMRGFLKGNIIKYALRQGLKEGESPT